MRTDIKQNRADILFKIDLNSKFSQLLLSNSEMDNEISKNHAEKKNVHYPLDPFLQGIIVGKPTSLTHLLIRNQLEIIN